MASQTNTGSVATGRRILAGTISMTATVVWTHAVAAVLAGVVGSDPHVLSEVAPELTVAALVTALAGVAGGSSIRRSATLALIAGYAGAALVALSLRSAMFPALALVPAGVAAAVLGAWMTGRGTEWLKLRQVPRGAVVALWALVLVASVVQYARLSTFIADKESSWFLSTTHPFFAKHDCANAYIYGAELSRRGADNVYDPAHYPGLNPQAEPHTEVAGLEPEDPFQYAPQFLLWPRLALAASNDYDLIQPVWFAMNVTLGFAAMLFLAAWIGGPIGAYAAFLAPVVMASFPVLHNFQYGQFHFAAVALAVLGLLAFQRGRSALGGTLLAVSILSKLFPGLLVIYLAAQRRWRDLAWTAMAGTAVTVLALGVLGTAPFVAFFEYHLPRLSDGSAFAFGEAWPEVADLLTAGNQGIYGIAQKLEALGVPGVGAAATGVATAGFAALLAAAAALLGFRAIGTSRAATGAVWVGLLGLASLSSTGAWADYVPLTSVWLLSMLLPMARAHPKLLAGLGLAAFMQFTLVGTMPIGGWFDPDWAIPLSLVGAMALLATLVGGVVPAGLEAGWLRGGTTLWSPWHRVYSHEAN